MPKSGCWVHEDPTQTAPTLKAMIESFAPHLCAEAALLASGPADGSNWTDTELSMFDCILEAAVAMDPRGGIFGQTDLETAMQEAFDENPALKTAMETAAATMAKSYEDLLTLLSFRIRGLTRRARLRRRSWAFDRYP